MSQHDSEPRRSKRDGVGDGGAGSHSQKASGNPASGRRRREPSPLRFAGAGIELAGTTLLLAGIGYWIDSRRGGGASVGTATGALLGFALGMYRLIRLAMKD